jgi:integrase/recombinase XerD
MQLADACDKFMEHCRTALTLSSHTLRAYEGDLRQIGQFLGHKKALSRIGKEELRQLIRHLRETRGAKESSIKRRIASLKLLFKWAIQEALLDTNPFDKLNERIRLPRRLPRALDRHDTQRLAASISPLFETDDVSLACRKTAIHLLLETGIRVSELTHIRLEDLSLSDHSIRIHGKGNRQRLVYFLSPSLKTSIERYLNHRRRLDTQHERLLLTSNARPLTPPLVRLWLKETATACGVSRHVTPHMLRHTCATRWLEHGLDIRFVQKLLGHHSISTTEIYTHVSDQGLRQALGRVVGDN